MNAMKQVLTGVLTLVVLAAAAVAQTTVTAEQARALIAEQKDFYTKMSRGDYKDDRYTVRWFVNARVYPDGRGETFLSPEDVTHYNGIRQLAAGARFLSYVDTAVDPGLRKALDDAFAAFVAPRNHTGQTPGNIDAYLNGTASPLKKQEMQVILDLLGRLELALEKIAVSVSINERPARAGASTGQTPGTTTQPAQPAQPGTTTGGTGAGPSLLGVGSQGGPGGPSTGAANPGTVAGNPAQPGTANPGGPLANPGSVANPGQGGLIPPMYPPMYPRFPQGGPIVIIITGDLWSIAQIINLLLAILMQGALQPPVASAPGFPQNPDPFALERAMYGTAGLVDQSARGMGLRPGVVPTFGLNISIK